MFPRLIVVAAVMALTSPAWAGAGIAFLGEATFSGDATDRSGLSTTLGNGLRQDRLGGFSAIDHLEGDVYLVLTDAGRPDPETGYACRVHEMRITVSLGSPDPIRAKLVTTRLITAGLDNGKRRVLNGLPGVLDPERRKTSLTLDPQAIRAASRRHMTIADGYGSGLVNFDGLPGQGLPKPPMVLDRMGTTPVPKEFVARRPTAADPAPATGVQPDHGFAGLARLGEKVDKTMPCLAAPAGPLVQDGGREGRNVRLYVFHALDGSSEQYVYPLRDRTTEISEVEAIDGDSYLVLERDAASGKDAKVKRVVRIELAGATDVTDVPSLPPGELPDEVRPVSQRDWLDLLDPAFGLAGEDFPAELDGLCLGPLLPDGRRLLLICTDNDLDADRPSRIWAFAVPARL